MFCCASIDQVKKAVVLFALITFSMLVQAEPADYSDSRVMQTGSGLESRLADPQQSFKFPRWSERMLADREMVPPPPPGPYMSSALSDFSVKGLSFSRGPDNYEANNSAFMFDPSNRPMDRYNPDRPWPKNLQSENTRLADRAIPENSHRYVYPRVKKNIYPYPYPVPENPVPFTSNYGYRVPDNIPARAYGPYGRMPNTVNRR